MSLAKASNAKKSVTTNTRVVARFRPINSIEKKEYQRDVFKNCIKEAQLEIVSQKMESHTEMKDPKNWPKYASEEWNSWLTEKFGMQTGHLRLFKRFCREYNFEKLDGSDFKDVVPIEVYEEQKQIQIFIPEAGWTKSFAFDEVMWWQRDQTFCFKKIAQTVMEEALHGFNATIFAYGQSGSGKTYTLFGPEPLETAPPELLGLIPSSLAWLFKVMQEDNSNKFFEVRVSFLEVYLEKLRDLINPCDKNGKEKKLKILELAGGKAALEAFRLKASMDSKISAKNRRGARLARGRSSSTSKKELPIEVIVDNLSELRVDTIAQVQSLISLAAKNRTKEKTNLNASSSRSHLIMTVRLRITKKSGTVIKSKINFADLAGSEKVGKTKVTGEHLKEASAINQSLTSLRTVIDSLVKQKKFVSFRDSKLTRALRDSLGGNTKTTLVLACSPHKWNLEETIETLKFGARAKFIRSKVIVNAQASVEQLQQEITKLKTENELLKKELCIEHAKQGIRRLEVEAPRSEAKTNVSALMLAPLRKKSHFDSYIENVRLEAMPPHNKFTSLTRSKSEIIPRQFPVLSVHHKSVSEVITGSRQDIQDQCNLQLQMDLKWARSEIKDLRDKLNEASQRETNFTNIVEELMERVDIIDHEKEVERDTELKTREEETAVAFDGDREAKQDQIPKTNRKIVENSLEIDNYKQNSVRSVSNVQEQSNGIQKRIDDILNENPNQNLEVKHGDEKSGLNEITNEDSFRRSTNKSKVSEEAIIDNVKGNSFQVDRTDMKLGVPLVGDIDSVLRVLETIAATENKALVVTLNKLMKHFQLAQLSLQTCMHVYTFLPEGKLTVKDFIEVVETAKLSLRLRKWAISFKEYLISVAEDFAELIEDLPSVWDMLPGDADSYLTMEDVLLVDLGKVQSLIFQEGFRFLDFDHREKVLWIDFAIFIEHLVGRIEILGLSEKPSNFENVECSGFRLELLEPISKIFEKNNCHSEDGTYHLSASGSKTVLQEIRESLEEIDADDPALLILQDLTLPNLETVIRSCPAPMWHILIEKHDYNSDTDENNYFF